MTKYNFEARFPSGYTHRAHIPEANVRDIMAEKLGNMGCDITLHEHTLEAEVAED